MEFEDLDEQQKIYYKRREERMQDQLLDECENEDPQVAEEREAERKLKEAAEDEMSDEEV